MDKKTKLPVAVIVTVTALVLLIIPAILSGTMTIEFFGKALGSADGWLSYWGGYLGAIVGLAAISVTTQFQINSQQKLHKEQLDAQEDSMVKMHEYQKEIQRYSVDKSSNANDRKERDRIYTSLLLNKNEELIEGLIELNHLHTERFNALKEYAYYESVKENFDDLKRKKFIENFTSKSEEPEILSGEEVKLKKRNLLSKIADIKKNETDIRIKIIGVSAKIKSKSMYFNALESQIDLYRVSISGTIDEFYNHVNNKDIDLEEFQQKVEKSSTELHDMTNKILNACQKNLSGIVQALITSERS